MESTVGLTQTWLATGAKLWRGFWNGADPVEVEVEEVAPPERRAEERLTHCARVLSKELPHFQALTLDVSDTGLRLSTNGPVEPGTRLTLSLQLHESDIFPIRFLGECVWNTRSDSGSHQIGVDVSPSNERALLVLERYFSEQKAISQGCR